jgi:hypothetical protein
VKTLENISFTAGGVSPHPVMWEETHLANNRIRTVFHFAQYEATQYHLYSERYVSTRNRGHLQAPIIRTHNINENCLWYFNTFTSFLYCCNDHFIQVYHSYYKKIVKMLILYCCNVKYIKIAVNKY